MGLLYLYLENLHFLGLYCTSAGKYNLGREVSVTLSLFMESITMMIKITTMIKSTTIKNPIFLC